MLAELESLLIVFFRVISIDLYYLFFIGAIYFTLLNCKRKQWLLAVIFSLTGIGWLALYDMEITSGWLSNLTEDVLLELDGFTLSEAYFWLQTMLNVFEPRINILRLLVFSLLAILSFFVVWMLLQKLNFKVKSIEKCLSLMAFFLIVYSLYTMLEFGVTTYVKNTNKFNTVSSNFNNTTVIPKFSASSINPKMVIYLGESTSILNMGLYGYPRDTTPNLSEIHKSDENIIVFNNVFSTHALTAPSLLKAFSFEVNKEEKVLPIYDQQRVSLVDVLKHAGVESFLLSNSGKSGSWNIATSIIFKSSSSKVFSSNIPAIGNWDLKDKPYDTEFFNNKVTSILTNNEQRVLFLHSYAGHGPYLELIPPEFKQKVDGFFSGINKKAIFGDLVINERNDLPIGRINLKQRSVLDSLLENVEGHDSAIRYIDHSISKIINEIKQLSEPVIFMYVSDHGESVFPGRSHDPSWFTHEMLRVPFIIYFNESARNQMPLVFEKYSKLAASNNVATLSQLSSTIMDLLGLNLSQHINNKNISFTKVIGENVILSPILSRRKRDGVEFINLNDSNLEQYFTSETYRTNEDAATKVFKASAFNQSKTRVCYHRSNTIAKFLRGKLVSDCLEIDVVVDSNGSIDVYHPPEENNTSLKLDFILNDVFGGEHALWIDGKNIHEVENCNILYESLKKYGKFKHEVLVEFPSDAINVLPTLKQCALELNNIGIFTSYYIDTGLAKNCSRKLNDGQEFSSMPACSELRDQLIEVNKSGIFTDISFDYAGLIAVKSVLMSDKLRWNTWLVEAGDFSKTTHGRFRMVILRNNDPNDLPI